MDPPTPQSVAPVETAVGPVPVQAPKLETAPVQPAAGVMGHLTRPQAAPSVTVDPPRPQPSLRATALPVPALALPAPEPAARAAVRAPRPRAAARATAPPPPASDLSVPAAAPRTVVDPPTPQSVEPVETALVPADNLPRPRAVGPVPVQAPKLESASAVLPPAGVMGHLTRPRAVPSVKVDPPRPQPSLRATALPVPALALPAPEPAARAAVRAPRPRAAARATAPPPPASALSVPAAAPRTAVDPPTPQSVAPVEAALVPADNLPRPRAVGPVPVQAPRPEAALPVAVFPTVHPGWEIRMGPPIRGPVTSAHTASTPTYRVEEPPEFPAHLVDFPPDQDAEAEDTIERKKRRLIKEAEDKWRRTARSVLRYHVPNIARKLAELSLKQGTEVCGFDLYDGARAPHQNACRCDESADAAARELHSALHAIAQKHYGGHCPPAVRDHWRHRSGDEYERDKAITAAMAEWERVSADTIERMVEAAIPADVRHLRDKLGGQQRLDAAISALTPSAQPQRERGRDRGPGRGYGC